jgi:hypothetical protein
LPEASQSRKSTGEKDGSTATEPVVEWNGQPTSNEGAAEIWCRVRQTNQPRIPFRIFITNAKVLLVEYLSSIDDSLVLKIKELATYQ